MKLYLSTKDYAFSQEEFALLFDTERNILVTHPRPKNLNEYYNSESYISHTDGKRGVIESLYQMVKTIMLKRKIDLIQKYAQKGKAVLDVGAGTGDFLRECKKNGWSIKGTEPNARARKLATEKGVNLYTGWQDLPEGQFNLITLWHVLEHLPDLDYNIGQLLSRLGEKGTLIIAVPNYRSYDARYYGQYWAAYDVPRHLWHFSRLAIKQLFEERGMKLVGTRPMLFDSFYVSLLSEKYKNGKTNYLRAFWIGLLSNIRAWRSKEYSSLIYLLQKA